MNNNYRIFFELQKEPFAADIPLEHILVTDTLKAVKKRIEYTIRLGAVALVTGEIGSGKSTALRYVVESLHPSQYRCLYLTASSGSRLELYRQLLDSLGMDNKGTSRAIMVRNIKQQILEMVNAKKLRTLLIIDEASMLRMEVLAELHTLVQFEKDAKPFLPLVLAGQNNLVDSLSYRAAMPLASRVIARSHLDAVNRSQMKEYLLHHLTIAGGNHDLFDDTALTAIHQGSGGLFRKANHLARGAIIAAAKQKCMTATADHVRMAATEIF